MPLYVHLIIERVSAKGFFFFFLFLIQIFKASWLFEKFNLLLFLKQCASVHSAGGLGDTWHSLVTPLLTIEHQGFGRSLLLTKGTRGSIMSLWGSSMVSGQVMLFHSSNSSLCRGVGVSRRWPDNGVGLSDLCFHCDPSYY